MYYEGVGCLGNKRQIYNSVCRVDDAYSQLRAWSYLEYLRSRVNSYTDGYCPSPVSSWLNDLRSELSICLESRVPCFVVKHSVKAAFAKTEIEYGLCCLYCNITVSCHMVWKLGTIHHVVFISSYMCFAIVGLRSPEDQKPDIRV